jgi:hypothetical protein
VLGAGAFGFVSIPFAPGELLAGLHRSMGLLLPSALARSATRASATWSTRVPPWPVYP